jgi:DNA-binding winged helix-turn-helix (wHTH) protein/Tfp pilus assembly protein PilF
MQFRGYSVDAVHRTVTSPEGRVARIEPKAFDLLLYFTQHPEETLSREQLVRDVWGGKFVTDDAVMVAVYALRQAFDDDSRAPKFIETIRGRGYRWMAASEPAAAPKPAPSFAPAWIGIVAIGVAALVWGVLRVPQPMPSIHRTSELVRAHARGLFFSERTTRRDLEEARTEFRKAIQIDSRFAEPHAALAEVCVRLIEFGAPAAENEGEARREVARAMELGPGLAFTHAALASVQFVLDRDLVHAERSFRHAIQLDPTLPDIHRRYSYLLGATGRFAEATEQAQLAADMEPASAAAMNDLAWTHLLAGRFDEAERLYRESLRLDSANAGTAISLGYCLELLNEPAAAMRSYHRALEILGAPADLLARDDRTFAASGLSGVYVAWLQRLAPNRNVPRFMLATYAARAGRTSEALDLLRQAAKQREPATLWLAVHPAFAPLRGQREFAALVASSFQTR